MTSISKLPHQLSYQMHFLSSKNVMQLETAFALILDSNRVKEGEQMLETMKKEKDFQLALATFISRSPQYNQRLLAILQLEKRLVIEDVQTVWSLKEVYFRDSDKIARKICKIVTAKENIRLASEFLVAEQNQTGSSIYRQIQVVFHMLKEEDKAIVAIEHHFELLCRYLQTVIGSLCADEDCFFLVLVSLLLFYDGCAKGGFEEYKEAVLLHWARIEGMIDCNSENAHLIAQTINHILYQRPINPKPSAFFNLLNETHSKTNPFKISYLCKALQIITQTHQLEDIQGAREQFISSMMRLRDARTRQMLINLKLYGDIEVQLNDELELQDNNETIVRRQCKNFIDAIFVHHQQWLQEHLNRSKQPLQTILTLANYYHSIRLPSLAEMIPSLIERVVDNFGQMINHNQDFSQKDIGLCITFIQFLNTFKAQIQISSLPNIVSLLIDGARVSPNLSPFCDSFVCDIWKELAFIPYSELIVWMGSQLEKINSNQWGVRLKSYEGFLNLAVYIEQAYRHFSTCTEDDRLLEVLVKSHSIMCEIMRENTSIKTDFQLSRVLLGVTCTILENERFKRSKKMHELLSIPFLVSLIERHLFLGEDIAAIVAFHRYHTNKLIASLEEEAKEWVMDQPDYEYRIQLYITELDYAEQLLPEAELLRMKQSLEAKIHTFLNSSQTTLPSQSKSDKLWLSLQHHFGITRHKTEMMDIQS